MHLGNLKGAHGTPPALLKGIMHTISRSTTSGSRWQQIGRLFLPSVVFTAIMLVPGLAFGQQFVDAPEPKLMVAPANAASTASPVLIQRKGPAHEFFDRPNLISL